jgi:hypothetical protein
LHVTCRSILILCPPRSFALLSALAGVSARHIKISVARAAAGAGCICAVRAYSQFAGSFSLGSVCADSCLLLFYVVLLLLERWPECDFELRAPAHVFCVVQLCTIPVSLIAHVLGLVGTDGNPPPFLPPPPLPPSTSLLFYPPSATTLSPSLGLMCATAPVPCICFIAATAAAGLDMVIVPLAFFKCVIDDTRVLLSGSVGDEGPSSQRARLLQVLSSHSAAPFHSSFCATHTLRLIHVYALCSTPAVSKMTAAYRSSGCAPQLQPTPLPARWLCSRCLGCCLGITLFRAAKAR